MRREIITWSVVAAIILGAFGGTVLILNSSLYSAGGFVRGYLDALARHDADGALDLAGTIEAGDSSTELLKASAMAELGDIQLVSDTDDGNGVHSVVYSWTADGTAGQSEFTVRRQGTLLGLFPTWAFEESPFGILQVSVLHATEFTVNGIDLQVPAQDLPTPYLAFTPGRYELSHKSKFLRAAPTTITVEKPGAAVIAPVDVAPTPALVAEVQTEINDHLDKDCATQEVLLPTGCPFGQEMGNRIVSTPQWSMVAYPQVTLAPGPQPASWLMRPTAAVAHLVVDVKSIFDGSVSTFDEDVPFTASYLVTFLPDDQVLITGQY